MSCDVCGAAVIPPNVRCCCPRCTHPIAAHTPSLGCITCRQACGINASRSYDRVGR